MKLGRIFKNTASVEISKDRKYISDSLYVAHLGGHEDFLRKLEYHLDNIPNKIIIADGAKWIWNWADAIYPDSIQVLDFYHAKEHLCQYANAAITDECVREQWIKQQSDSLLDDGIKEVISVLKSMDIRGSSIRKLRKTLIAYYQANSHRMLYKTYKQQGIAIGSGAIEAAHRNVIQQRMKLSGQRWTMEGAQQMANLRVAFKSNQWNTVAELTKKAA